MNTDVFYQMPSYATLIVQDLQFSTRWYQKILGFELIFQMPGPGGQPSLSHLRWAKYADLMLMAETSNHSNRGLKGSGVTLTFAVTEGATVPRIWAGIRPTIAMPLPVRPIRKHKWVATTELDGRVEHEILTRISGFRFSETDTVVKRASSAIRATGIEPSYAISCGGSDANELNAKGLTTVVLSVGYKDIHSVEESMPIDELDRLANVCAALMLAK